MSDLIPTNITIPAHLANRVGKPSALATSITGGISGGGEFGPRISIKGSRFRIVDGDSETVLPQTTIEVVIVGASPKLSKTWYAKKWDPAAEPTAPDCYSLDGVAPHPDSEMPQNDLCATCPHNAWGSRTDDTGLKKLKACADSKRLAVVAAESPDGPVYLLSVTRAALKGLNAFQKELQMRGIAPEIVKTKVGFDTDASFPKLTFGFGGFLDVQQQTSVDKLFGTREVLVVTGEEVVVAAKPAVEAPKPAVVKVKETPVVEKPKVVEEAETAEEAAVHPDLAAGKGFGGGTTVTKEAKPKPEVKPAVVGNDQGVDLADEIANILAGMTPDDEA